MDNKELLRESKRKIKKIEYFEDNPRMYILLSNIIKHLREEIKTTQRRIRITNPIHRPRASKRKRTAKDHSLRKRQRIHFNNDKESSTKDDRMEGMFDGLPKDVGCMYHGIIKCNMCSSVKT